MGGGYNAGLGGGETGSNPPSLLSPEAHWVALAGVIPSAFPQFVLC